MTTSPVVLSRTKVPARKIGCGVCEEKSGVAGLRRSQILTAPGEWLSTRDELRGSSEYRALVAGEGADDGKDSTESLCEDERRSMAQR